MVAYLVEILKAGGVPEADIATLDDKSERALIVRIPGREEGRPILFSAHMDVVDARPEDDERGSAQVMKPRSREANAPRPGTARSICDSSRPYQRSSVAAY